MGTGVPLLNEYKQEFLWKRFPQTVLGGPKLRIGYEAPAYVYLNQCLLFVLPLFLGVSLTAAAAATVDSVSSFIYAGVFAALMFLVVLITNLISAVSHAKKSRVAPVVPGRVNLVADEDEVMFESCCGPETIEFVVPGKKFKLNILLHALISGLIGGMGFLYLVPENLDDLYGDNVAATAIVCGLGWLVMMIGLYSLTVRPPPEWAQFRSIDTQEHYTPLMRPFYIGAFCAVDIAARYHPELLLCNQVLHVIFLFLPFLWMFGLLPPLDALFPWLFEQAHVILFGGSPMASDIRTLIYTLVSLIIFIILYLVTDGYARVAIMATCGFILSLNLGGLGQEVIDRYSKEKSDTLHLMTLCKGFLWRWSWKEVLFHVILLIVAVGTAVGVYAAAQQTDLTDVGQYLGLASWALVVLDVILSQLQSVYVLFGLVRNKLFPKSVARTSIFTASKKKLRILGIIRRILMEFVAPLMMLAYLSTSLQVNSFGDVDSDSNSTSTLGVDLLGAARAYRWVWQSSFWFLLEAGVVSVLWELLPATSGWSTMSLGLRLLLLSLARDRVVRLFSQLRAILAVALSTWLEPKQRRPSTVPMLVVNCVLFPLLCLLPAAIASCLAAPLLPLFTLPVFLIGYPRPARFWPGPVGASANVNEDTSFYRQLTPQLCTALRQAFANGSMGDPWAGSHFIARFQDRLVWLQVIERGYGYCTLSVKGLELQETSCHTVEASRIDDIVDTTFERESVPCCLFNKYPLCSLRPKDAALIKTYSDAKNQLTGIIDSPDTLAAVVRAFQKTMTWVLLREVRRVRQDPQHRSIAGNIELHSRRSSTTTSHQHSASLQSLNKLGSESAPKPVVRRDSRGGGGGEAMHSRKLSVVSALSYGVVGDWSDTDSIISTATSSRPTCDTNTPIAQHIRRINNEKNEKNEKKPAPASSDDYDFMDSINSSNSNKKSGAKKYERNNDVDNLFETLGFGMPAQDTAQQNGNSPQNNNNPRLPLLQIRPTPVCEMIKLSDPSKLSSLFSLQLAPMTKWLEVPSLAVKNSRDLAFSREWYQHVIKLLGFSGDKAHSSSKVTELVAADNHLCWVYEQLVTACHTILNVLGSSGGGGMVSGPMHVCKIYNGEIPWSKASDWITGDPHLLSLVLKAYRYAVKVAIEEAIMGGEESTDEELQEYMEEYDSTWYIGTEKEKEWAQAVAESKPQLFSFTHDPVARVFNSRVLSLTETPVYLGALSSELVHAQWANLNLELYYLTNDDEERYSIQANATLLRNLTVQAANPPLGYPIYASEPITVPTL